MSWELGGAPASVCVLIMFLVYYVISPRLPLRLNKYFVALLALQITTEMLDLISTFTLMRPALFTVPEMYAANSLYFEAFIARATGFFVFLAVAMGVRQKEAKGLYISSLLIAGVSSIVVLSSCFTGAVFSISTSGKYANGPLYWIVYAILFVYIAMGLFVLIKRGAKLTAREMSGAVGCILILVFGGIARYMFPSLLIMDLFCTLAIILLYLTFENPEHYYDSRFSVYNRFGFERSIDEFITGDKRFELTAIGISNYRAQYDMYDYELMSEVMASIGTYLRAMSWQNSRVFYIGDGIFVSVDKPEKIVPGLRQEILHRFELPWEAGESEINLKASFVHMSSELNVKSAELLKQTIKSSLAENEKAGSMSITEVDQVILDGVHRSFLIKRTLLNAIKENAILVYYQPIVDAGTMKVVAIEALARLENDELGMIGPRDFIPIAEATGSITALGEQVLSKACAFCTKNNLKRMGIESLNVNLSPMQCVRPTIAEEITAIVNETGVNPSDIQLEINEEAPFAPVTLFERMADISKQTFEFSLNDYGSGFSKMLRLKRIPFSNLKLDMQVVWDHFKTGGSLLENEIKVFRDLDLNVTAQGVETAEMAKELRKIGCTHLQGFYFSKPLPEDQLITFVTCWNSRDHSDLM